MNHELMHYGVKGMKWGVRRTPAQLGHNPSSNSVIKDKKLASMDRNSAMNKLFTNRKHVSEVTEQFKKDYDELKTTPEGKKIYSNLKSAEKKFYSTYRNEDFDAYNDALNEWNKHTRDISKTYVDKFNTAQIKDLGFDNINVGKEYLNSNRLNVVDNYGQIMSFTLYADLNK